MFRTLHLQKLLQNYGNAEACKGDIYFINTTALRKKRQQDVG